MVSIDERASEKGYANQLVYPFSMDFYKKDETGLEIIPTFAQVKSKEERIIE
ncbi:MAG: hypothetical protein J6P83_05870 [Bacteroidales bacterium]|nr:hypothetical protein [Bacteroidales bacterium]